MTKQNARISIIIPTLNEADNIARLLDELHSYSNVCEIIVVDGGSNDSTATIADKLTGQLLHSPKGRAKQMNFGAIRARHEILLFLHADTFLPPDALTLVQMAINQGAVWGRFEIELTGKPKLLNLVSFMINLRSRLSTIATGDQAIFMTQTAYRKIAGFDDIALMEDISISRKLSRLGKPALIRQKVKSSGRRWEKYGMLRTITLMWWLRLNYRLGRSPDTLEALYRKGKFWKH